ncbi:Cytochrome C oxidase, cbb3-type, subunit III [Bryocella elongata]|uniref:Cytochrome C oxidase, cbb3-type, subunit III n=1 Tax=Bryocella elongata TaxID=863522 RepID=A0A1H5YKT1_9BACT|nr:cytochrome c [Bryocella elongata]SEG24330.1 Cytochrome C oxidase, cbb3-type, subunit III [Bryocella elongata]
MQGARSEKCSHGLNDMTEARLSYLAFALLLLLLPLLLAGCKSTPPPKPLDQLTAEETRGHEVFQARCSQCHYDRETGDLHGPSLLSLYKKPYLPSGAPANDDRVSAVIENGRNMMPPTHGLEPGSADFSAVIAYLHTL